MEVPETPIDEGLEGSPTNNMIILVVTLTGLGVNQTMTCIITHLFHLCLSQFQSDPFLFGTNLSLTSHSSNSIPSIEKFNLISWLRSILIHNASPRFCINVSVFFFYCSMFCTVHHLRRRFHDRPWCVSSNVRNAQELKVTMQEATLES